MSSETDGIPPTKSDVVRSSNRYGFQTSTRTKILVMLSLSDIFVRDLDMITVNTREGSQ